MQKKHLAKGAFARCFHPVKYELSIKNILLLFWKMPYRVLPHDPRRLLPRAVQEYGTSWFT